MSTALVLGNGNMLVNLDERLHMTDLYWPHVGKNNHLMGHHIRTYFWDYGHLVSFEDTQSFQITPEYSKDSLYGKSTIVSENHGVIITVENTVLPHKDIYLAKYTITNKWDMKRDLKIFVNHDFYIKGHNIGDTSCWYPMSSMLFHYKGNTYLGVGSISGISQYACGKSHSYFGGGTLPDTKTGILSGRPIEHGAVESTIGFDVSVEAGSTKSFDYFIACGNNFNDCTDSMKYIQEKGVDHILDDTQSFWKSYITTSLDNIKDEDVQILEESSLLPDPIMSERIKDIFLRSLAVIRTQIDNGGSVIAANDSAHIKYRKFTYEYMWPRDAALTISSIDKFGYSTIADRFFRFSTQLLSEDGYFMHLYDSTGALGSSWHPWVDEVGNPQLPIQEDETALVLWSLWKHYEYHKNQELISDLWERLIKPAADFLCDYRLTEQAKNTTLFKKLQVKGDNKDILEECFKNSGLPMPSYDVWEEKKGIFTYTCATVYSGLLGASILALKLGQHDEAEKYSKVAYEIKKATIENLYDKEKGHFIHGLYKDYQNNACAKSERADASIMGIWLFDMLPVDDIRVIKTMEWLEDELWNKNSIGGALRYNNDDYYRRDANQNGNPWYITTLWFAQYYIKKNEIGKAIKYLKWVTDNTHGTDLMAEQIDSVTGEDLSVKPLTWSHAEFVRTVGMLLDQNN